MLSVSGEKCARIIMHMLHMRIPIMLLTVRVMDAVSFHRVWENNRIIERKSQLVKIYEIFFSPSAALVAFGAEKRPLFRTEKGSFFTSLT